MLKTSFILLCLLSVFSAVSTAEPKLIRVDPSSVYGCAGPRTFTLTGSGFKSDMRVEVTYTNSSKILDTKQVEFIDSSKIEFTIITSLDVDNWNVKVLDGDDQFYGPVGFAVTQRPQPLPGEYGSIIGEYLGIKALSNGKCAGSESLACMKSWQCDARYQCVDFVKRFYEEHHPSVFKADVNTKWGSAKTFWKDDDKHTKLTKTTYQDTGVKKDKLPLPGDMIFFDVLKDGLPNKIGHVAIVTDVKSEGLKIIQQNMSPNEADDIVKLTRDSDVVQIHPLRNKYAVLGWLSPEPTPSTSTSPSPTPIPASGLLLHIDTVDEEMYFAGANNGERARFYLNNSAIWATNTWQTIKAWQSKPSPNRLQLPTIDGADLSFFISSKTSYSISSAVERENTLPVNLTANTKPFNYAADGLWQNAMNQHGLEISDLQGKTLKIFVGSGFKPIKIIVDAPDVQAILEDPVKVYCSELPSSCTKTLLSTVSDWFDNMLLEAIDNMETHHRISILLPHYYMVKNEKDRLQYFRNNFYKNKFTDSLVKKLENEFLLKSNIGLPEITADTLSYIATDIANSFITDLAIEAIASDLELSGEGDKANWVRTVAKPRVEILELAKGLAPGAVISGAPIVDGIHWAPDLMSYLLLGARLQNDDAAENSLKVLNQQNISSIESLRTGLTRGILYRGIKPYRLRNKDLNELAGLLRSNGERQTNLLEQQVTAANLDWVEKSASAFPGAKEMNGTDIISYYEAINGTRLGIDIEAPTKPKTVSSAPENAYSVIKFDTPSLLSQKKLDVKKSSLLLSLVDVLSDELHIVERTRRDMCYYGALSTAEYMAKTEFIAQSLKEFSADIISQALGGVSTGSVAGDILLKLTAKAAGSYLKGDNLQEELLISLAKQTLGYITPAIALSHNIGPIGGYAVEELSVEAVKKAMKKGKVVSSIEYKGTNITTSYHKSQGAPLTQVKMNVLYSPVTNYTTTFLNADCGEFGKGLYIFRYQLDKAPGGFGRAVVEDTIKIIKEPN
jgi:hypothetical protein